MRLRRVLIAGIVVCLLNAAVAAPKRLPAPAAKSSLTTSFLNLDLESARKQSDRILARNPISSLALLVRMEAAELEMQTDVALDSALRLCSIPVPRKIANIASGRILQHAANTRAFQAVLPRIEALARQSNRCSSNLRLALAAAASDGNATLNLEQAVNSAGLLTRWRLAGPFGRYNNADFDRQWAPELDRLSQSSYGELHVEEFWWRDGWITLPDYLSSSGIFYAASDIDGGKTGDSLLRVFSSGPYAVFVDGGLALTHDSRYHIGTGQDSAVLKLNAGKHRVMIKLTPDALPLQAAICPDDNTAMTQDAFDAGSMHAYIDGLSAFLADDLPGLARAVRQDPSRAGRYLYALLESADGNSSRTRSAWQAVTATSPEGAGTPAPLARFKLAEMNSETEPGASEEFRQEVSSLARALPNSEPVQELAFATLHSDEPLERLIALHPSCSHLSRAVKFFGKRGEQDRAQKIERQLANCSPESLLYPDILSGSGRHSEAADYLLHLLSSNPLNRMARRMLIQELLLANAGREPEAAEQAKMLHQIAPNSNAFAGFASDPFTILDASSMRATEFTQQQQFYAPYRRNAFQIIQKTNRRHFVGGLSLTLLADKVLEVRRDGSISVYVHRITRLLNKDGISRVGEVSIPRGADLLELRTIKSTGQTVEPELTLQKPTISMPALEPGDNIEEEFVVHYHAWDEAPADAGEFTFGSFQAPVLYARFTLIAPENSMAQVAEQNNAPLRNVEHLKGTSIQTWERNDIAQAAPEDNLPPENQLPLVAVSPADNPMGRLRDDLISVTRIGVQVDETSQTFKRPGKTENEKARELYHFAVSRIQSLDAEWNANNAEDTLLNSGGSRTAALLALARSAGLKAGLVLARKIGGPCPDASGLSCYTTPLVRFWFSDGSTVDTAVESSSILPFGIIPADLNTGDALLAPATREDETHPQHISLVDGASLEKSQSEGELYLDENGAMKIELHVRLGASRGQQVRNILRQANQHERRMFFDQLAMRIFPGAVAVEGSSKFDSDFERPLELTLRCEVSQNINSNNLIELDQLVPALGLRELYATNSTRKFPLYISSVLFESTTFHLHLSSSFQMESLPANFTGSTEFGSYAAQFKSSGREITIQRVFQIPVQIVPAQKYGAFASFAGEIDAAERGRITLAFHGIAAEHARLPFSASGGK